jgi:hypothetical protein
MNRIGRRSEAARKRSKGTVSAAFVQKKLQSLEEETARIRDTLFAIARAQGRIVIKKSDLRELEPGDGIDVAESDDGANIIITFNHGEAAGEKTNLVELASR